MKNKNKYRTKVQYPKIDLTKRSDIVIEKAKEDTMSHEEMIAMLNELSEVIRNAQHSTDDYDFIIREPKRMAIIKMQRTLKERFGKRNKKASLFHKKTSLLHLE